MMPMGHDLFGLDGLVPQQAAEQRAASVSRVA
jgi:hypothetical protein